MFEEELPLFKQSLWMIQLDTSMIEQGNGQQNAGRLYASHSLICANQNIKFQWLSNCMHMFVFKVIKSFKICSIFYYKSKGIYAACLNYIPIQYHNFRRSLILKKHKNWKICNANYTNWFYFSLLHTENITKP